MGKVKTAHNPPNIVDNTTNLFGSGKPEPKKKQAKKKEEPKKSKKQTYREERKSGNLSEESKKYVESRQKQAKDKRREREVGRVFGKKQVTYRIKDDKTGYKTVTRVGKEDKYVDSTGKEYKKFDKNKRVVEADTQYVHSKSGKGKERVEAKSKDKKRKYKAQLRHLQRSPIGRHGGKLVVAGGLVYGGKKYKDNQERKANERERQSVNEPHYDRPLKEKAKRYAEDWVRRHTR